MRVLISLTNHCPVMPCSLCLQEVSELTERLKGLEGEKDQLQRDLSDAHTSLQNQALVQEVRRRSEDNLRQLQEEATLWAER